MGVGEITMTNRTRQWFKILCAFVWTVLAAGSFVKHFPVVHAVEIALNGTMLAILSLFFIAFGRRVLRHFHFSFASFTEECCFAFGVGTGVIILLVIALAAIQLLYEMLIVALILLLFALVYQDARYICVTWYERCITFYRKKTSFEEMIFLVLIGVAGVATFLAAATPPFFYDALAYHVALPSKYLLRHGFHDLPHFHPAGYPANISMLFVVTLSFAGGMLTKLLSWSFAPLTALAVYAFAKSRWNSRIALSSAAILLLAPVTLITSTLTTIDLAVMFYSFLCFAALFAWFEQARKEWFGLAVIFCSLAAGAKYTALVTTFAPAVLMLFIHTYFVKRRSFLSAVRNVVIFTSLIGIGMSPWFIKNMVYTGNPLYPLFHASFEQAAPIAEYQQIFLQEGQRLEQGIAFLVRWLQSPWSVTMSVSGAAGKSGVLFLLCLPGILWMSKGNAFMRNSVIMAGSSFGLWFLLLPRMLRFVLPVFPLLSLASAYALWQLSSSILTKRLIFGGATVILLYQFMLFGVEQATILHPFGYLFGNQPTTTFLLQHGINYYPVIEYINAETPIDAKILFVGELRGYYCQRDYIIHHVIENEHDALRQLILESQNITDLMGRLRERGITHILINHSEMQRLAGSYLGQTTFFDFRAEKDQQIFQDVFSSRHLRLLTDQYNVSLYEIIY